MRYGQNIPIKQIQQFLFVWSVQYLITNERHQTDIPKTTRLCSIYPRKLNIHILTYQINFIRRIFEKIFLKTFWQTILIVRLLEHLKVQNRSNFGFRNMVYFLLEQKFILINLKEISIYKKTGTLSLTYFMYVFNLQFRTDLYHVYVILHNH